MEVSNGPRQPEAQRIKRYSTAARLPTLSLLTYPSARQKLSYRLDPICVLEVGWTLVLCGRDRYWCFHDTVQWGGECWGTSGGFGEFRICNYLLPALLEATWLNPATGASSLPLHRLTLKISCSRMVVKMGHLHNPHVTCSSYFVHAIFFPFKNIFLLCSYLKCHKRSMKKNGQLQADYQESLHTVCDSPTSSQNAWGKTRGHCVQQSELENTLEDCSVPGKGGKGGMQWMSCQVCRLCCKDSSVSELQCPVGWTPWVPAPPLVAHGAHQVLLSHTAAGASKWNLKPVCQGLFEEICQMCTLEKRKIKNNKIRERQKLSLFSISFYRQHTGLFSERGDYFQWKELTAMAVLYCLPENQFEAHSRLA